MTLTRTVADVLSRHVSFEIETIDRMYCNVYQPKLQYTAGDGADVGTQAEYDRLMPQLLNSPAAAIAERWR